MRLRFANTVSVTNVVLVFAALILAIVGFLQDQQRKIQQFTVEYAQRYYSSDLIDARSELREFVRKIDNVDPSITNDEIAKILADVIQKPANGNLIESAVVVSDYFNGAMGCVQAGLCDADLLSLLHSNEATSLYCVLGPGLEAIALKGGEQALSAGLRFFAAESGC